MATIETGSFTAPSQVLTFDGLLSDFDGTIVDSTDGMRIPRIDQVYNGSGC